MKRNCIEHAMENRGNMMKYRILYLIIFCVASTTIQAHRVTLSRAALLDKIKANL